MRSNLLFLLALAACVKPETGIDRTVISGTVRVLPTFVEATLLNEKLDSAQDLGDLKYGWTVITGDIDRYAEIGGNVGPAADEEYFLFTTGRGGEAAVRIRVGEAPVPALPMPADTDGDTDTGAPDTDEPADTDTDAPVDTDEPADTDTDAPVDTDEPADTDTGVPTDTDTGTDTALPPGPTLRIDLLDVVNVDEEGEPTVVVTLDATEGDWELPVELVARGGYALRIGGLYGDEGVAMPYRVEMQATHPDVAAIKVGAYASADVLTRGAPVAGASVQPFVLEADLSYTGAYEMLGGVRAVTSVDPTPEDEDPLTENSVEEGVSEVWIYAGDWSGLNAGIRAGTWYTSVPAMLDLSGASELYVADPVTLDTYAAAQIGQEFVDTEPNDADVELADTTQAQDLGLISDLGFVDIVTGSVTFTSTDADWVHDIDAYRLMVPVPSQLFFNLDWPGADVDLDVLIMDAEANVLDVGYYGHPEVNEYGFEEAMMPDTEYYLLVLGYLGDPAVETPYELRMELAPF